jgi:hypothetical protein
MLLAPETLIDGVVRTLRETVLPAVESRVARTHLYAVLDVLQNLRDRVGEKPALLAAEAESAAGALERAAGALPASVGTRIRESVTAGEPAERRTALRVALVAALEAIDQLPPDGPGEARAAITAHLGEQAMRDVALLKPSLLNEISKG